MTAGTSPRARRRPQLGSAVLSLRALAAGLMRYSTTETSMRGMIYLCFRMETA
jgi:hypothetical protein